MQEKAKEPEIRFAGFTGAWEQRELGEISEIKTGPFGSSLHASDYVADGVPIITTEHFKFGSIEKNKYLIPMVSDTDHSRLIAYSLKTGDIVFSRVGSVDINALVEPESDGWLFSGRVLRVRSSEKYDSGFLHNLLETDDVRNDIRNRAVGQTMPSINTQILSATELTIPSSKREQQRIGNFFKGINQLLTLHQRKYEKLLNIKKSMLEKMFPKEGEVVPEIRFKGFTGAWEQRKFGEMANRRSEVSASGNLPRVEYEDIVSGTGTLNKDVFEKQSQKQGIVFHSGDVLYGKLRPYLQNWLLASFNGLAVGDFWVLEPQGLNSNYLYRIIQTKQFDEIANQSVGTKMPRADWKLVSKATFLNPASFNEQRLIGKFFKDIDSLLTLHQRKLEMLKNVKQAFLEKMFV